MEGWPVDMSVVSSRLGGRYLLGVKDNIRRRCLMCRKQICGSNGCYFTAHENSVMNTSQGNKTIRGFTENIQG